MSSFSICECGYTKNNHEFKHEYKNNTQIVFQDGVYIINCFDFPEKQKEPLCSQPQCGKSKFLHDAKLYEHTFTPGNPLFYRHVRVAFPHNTLCCENGCTKTAIEHMTQKKHEHPFKIKVKLLQKKEEDIIHLFVQEYECRKIKYCEE